MDMGRGCFVALLLAVWLQGAVGGTQPLNLACEAITGIDWCTECSSNPRKCYMCHFTKTPVWSSTGSITSCKATTTGATCRSASGDAKCNRCDGNWCVQCLPGYYLDPTTYVCKLPSTNALTKCRQLSGNNNCAQCGILPTGDWMCLRCSTAGYKVAPLNAMFINAGFPIPNTKCMSVPALNADAKRVTYENAYLPAGCVGVDSEFQCERCNNGGSLRVVKPGTKPVCVAFANGNKCPTNLPFAEYCETCVNGKCTKCSPGRGLNGATGQCSLPCRLLYGIGCVSCNTARCTARDPSYANGRR